MRNVKFTSSRTMKSPAVDPRAVYNWMGWEDYRNNAGYPQDYDMWTESQQRNYELGRAQAAIVTRDLKKGLVWDLQKTLAQTLQSSFDSLSGDLLTETKWRLEKVAS